MTTLRNLCVLAALALGASPVGAGAQTAAPAEPPPPPSEPFINPAPDFSAWAIVRQIVPGASAQAADVVLKSAVEQAESTTLITKTGPIRHQLRKLKTGEQEDIWYERGSRIIMESMWKIPMLEGGTSGANMPQGPDFPELNWISAKNYVGTQEYQKTVYFVFETQATQIVPTQLNTYGLKATPTFNRVYINADTRYPYLLQIGDILTRYVFQAPPKEMLVVPPEYQEMFDAIDRKRKEALRKPAAP